MIMKETKMIKILIVDDSKVSQHQLKHIFESDGSISVVGIASDGEEGVRLAAELKPDVVSMDINMPIMNGLEATRKIMESDPIPIVIVSASYDPKNVEKSFLAIEAGAVAIVEKPYGPGNPDYEKIANNVLQTVKLMSEVKVVRRWPRSKTQPKNSAPEIGLTGIKLVAIGASTGGPPVLQTILSGLDKGFPYPIVIVQHIAKGFLEGLVEWLKATTPLTVKIATDGEHLLPGSVYFGPDDYHMAVTSGGRVQLSKETPENSIRPSISHLFRSAGSVYGANMAAVLLTGMGKDGAEELKELKDKGAVTIIQDRESSIVYGMPGEALKLGGAELILTPEKISAVLDTLAKRPN